jgi:hypothetical protein
MLTYADGEFIAKDSRGLGRGFRARVVAFPCYRPGDAVSPPGQGRCQTVDDPAVLGFQKDVGLFEPPEKGIEIVSFGTGYYNGDRIECVTSTPLSRPPR